MFFVVALVDWMWGRYIIHTAQKNAVKSSLYASILTAFGAYITISYVSDHRMLIPAVLGAFVGTYISVKMSRD